MATGRKLISSREAVEAKCQHKTPCSDCPWARDSLKGWLGTMTPEEWLAAAHSETSIECHTLLGAQCAGSAIYRANVCKTPRYPEILQLPKDPDKVFTSPMQFHEHHTIKKAKSRTEK
jgi:hypothetical protein